MKNKIKPDFTEKMALANELDTLWGIVDAGDDYHARWFKIIDGKASEIGVTEYRLVIEANGIKSTGYDRNGVSEVVKNNTSPTSECVGKSIHWYGDKLYKEFTINSVKYLQLTERAIFGRLVNYNDMVALFDHLNKRAHEKSVFLNVRYLPAPTWEFEWKRIRNK